MFHIHDVSRNWSRGVRSFQIVACMISFTLLTVTLAEDSCLFVGFHRATHGIEASTMYTRVPDNNLPQSSRARDYY